MGWRQTANAKSKYAFRQKQPSLPFYINNSKEEEEEEEEE